MLEREDLKQVRSAVKDALREAHLDNLPDLFSREHHKHRGTHDLTFQQLVDAPDYVDNRQFITIVNEDEDGMAFVDLLGTDHQVVVTKNPHDITLSLDSQLHIFSDTEQPYIRISNLSATARDPALQFALGALDEVKFTTGVDDDDADAWLLCSGDILTSVVTAGATTMVRSFDGMLYVVDTGNDRLKKHLSADAMTYISKIGSTGTGDDNFNVPQAICNDGTYLYICDRVNHRIVKRKMSDLAFVAEVGSVGAGNDNFNTPWGICTDGTHIYITDSGNNRIKKHLCSTLAYVAQATVADSNPLDIHDINTPKGICTDGIYLYFTQNSGATCRLVILLCSTLADVLQIHDDGYIDSCTLLGICVTGGYLYITNTNNPATLKHVYKYAASSLTYITHWGVFGTGVGQMTQAQCIDTDGTTLWLFDYATMPDSNRLMKFLLDGTYVATHEHYGTTGDDEFHNAQGLTLGGAISFTTTSYRAPILKAGLDGSYVDAYPLLRARDGFQLMEDGTVAATEYVGLYAPAAITASYSLTFPGTGPAAAGHFAVDAAGLITWGQNLITTASPSFARLTLTQAGGTAPMTITSTTKVTNLNADLLDGYHYTSFAPATHYHDSDYITIIASPAANHFPYQTAGGELIDSTYDAADFAAAAHSHAFADLTDYPADGVGVLTNDGAGVLSWGPAGGSLAFADLTDYPADAVGVLTNDGAGNLSWGAGGSLAFADLTDYPADAAGVLTNDGAGNLSWAAGGGAHVLLSATHTDTLADTVIAGDLLIGNATPKWARLAAGAVGQIMEMGAALPGWGRKITISASDPSGGSDGDFWMKF